MVKTYKQHLFSCLPKQNFPSFRFLFYLRGFDNALNRAFLIFLFYGHALLFINIFLLITNTLFYKQLGSGPSTQSCLYFQDFQDSKLLNGRSVL